MDNKADVEKILEFIENYSTQGQEAPITTKSSSSVKDATTTTGLSLISIILTVMALQTPIADMIVKLNEDVFNEMIQEIVEDVVEEQLEDMDVKEDFKEVYEAVDELGKMSKEEVWKLREKLSELEGKVERELYWAKLQKLSEGNTAP